MFMKHIYNKIIITLIIQVFLLQQARAYTSLKVKFYSASVQQALDCYILLPDSYFLSDNKFKTMYILHGFSGYYMSWVNYACFDENLADSYQTIFIFPDMGNSFYLNWKCQTDGKPHQWENALVDDLIPFIDKMFASDTSYRMLGGLSMGGYGALQIGIKHAHLFKAILSSAGCIDITEYIQDEIRNNKNDWNQPELWYDTSMYKYPIQGFASQIERTPKGSLFCDISDVLQNDIYYNIRQQKHSLPYIVFDCGLHDDHLSANRKLAAYLQRKNIAFDYIELEGNHEHPYWKNALDITLPILFSKVK